MKRPRLLWSAVAVVLGALALLCAFETGCLPWPWSLESRARAVRPGMTPADVEAVMGEPPAVKAPWVDPVTGEAIRPGWRSFWYGEGGAVGVDFDADGRAEGAVFVAAPRGR